ncbi:unnamed protein product [Cylindrotheca closterium]|uniref:EF-hand domain-containing protein n=1 Tax=Cylindrotheca closterium TaxID=2856 RepID=A0AAD2FW27_9STRA|nr:unnamed protein product [Cylindrotheca closterium]
MNPSKRGILWILAASVYLAAPVDAFSASSQKRKLTSSSPPPVVQQSSRRQYIAQTLGGIISGAGILVSNPTPSVASSTARVQKWPGVEYLEPVYELKLSFEAIAKASEDESQYASLQQRLEKFFKGTIYSERNVYAGVALSYTTQIQYDPNEIQEYARLDQQERFDLMENALDNLRNLYISLPSTPDATVNKQDISDFANGATACMRRWFSLIATAEVDRAKELYEAARSADANKDGKVDVEELQAVPEEYRTLWKKRLEFTGIGPL